MADPAERFAQETPAVRSAEAINTSGVVHYYHGELEATPGRVRLFTVAPDATGESVHDAFARAASAWYNTHTHPNVVTVHDRGTDPRPWIAVELIDGRPLNDIQNDLSVPEIRTIVSDVAEALRNAALYNTTHGAISSEVVWVTETDGGVQAIVDDWGLERACRVAADETPTTPFTAPELHDTPETTSEKADVYSLGAVTYYALTGHPPNGPVKTGDGGPVPPSNATDYPGIDEAVDTVVLTALAADPDDRHDSAYTFQSAITRVLPAESPATLDKAGSDAVSGESDETDASDSDRSNTDTSPANDPIVDQSDTDTASLFGLSPARSVASIAVVGVVLLTLLSLSSACFIPIPQANSLLGVDCAGSGDSFGENGSQPIGSKTDIDGTDSETADSSSNPPMPNSDDSNSSTGPDDYQPNVSTVFDQSDQSLFGSATEIDVTMYNGTEDISLLMQNDTDAGRQILELSSLTGGTTTLYQTSDYTALRNTTSGEIQYGEPDSSLGFGVAFAAVFVFGGSASYVDIVEWQKVGTNADGSFVYEANALNQTALDHQEGQSLTPQLDQNSVQSVDGRIVVSSDEQPQSINVEIQTADGVFGTDMSMSYDPVSVSQPGWVDESQAP